MTSKDNKPNLCACIRFLRLSTDAEFQATPLCVNALSVRIYKHYCINKIASIIQFYVS